MVSPGASSETAPRGFAAGEDPTPFDHVITVARHRLTLSSKPFVASVGCLCERLPGSRLPARITPGVLVSRAPATAAPDAAAAPPPGSRRRPSGCAAAGGC